MFVNIYDLKSYFYVNPSYIGILYEYKWYGKSIQIQSFMNFNYKNVPDFLNFCRFLSTFNNLKFKGYKKK